MSLEKAFRQEEDNTPHPIVEISQNERDDDDDELERKNQEKFEKNGVGCLVLVVVKKVQKNSIWK